MNNRPKDILITGASGAIGNALATRFAALNYVLHLTSREPKRLAPLCKRLQQTGTTVYVYRLELDQLRQSETVIRRFFAQAKNPSVLICNAGNLGVIERFRKTEFKRWNQSITENFLGQAALIHAFVNLFVKKKCTAGTIITLSGAGLGSNTTFDRLSSYSTAKAALTHLVEALAPELAEVGLTINAIAPGQVLSGITRQALRAGKKAGVYAQSAQQCVASGGVSPELTAELAEFLVSPAARSVSGRLLSARFDAPALKANPDAVAQDPNRYRLRRIDNDRFEAKSA